MGHNQIGEYLFYDYLYCCKITNFPGLFPLSYFPGPFIGIVSNCAKNGRDPEFGYRAISHVAELLGIIGHPIPDDAACILFNLLFLQTGIH